MYKTLTYCKFQKRAIVTSATEYGCYHIRWIDPGFTQFDMPDTVSAKLWYTNHLYVSVII